MVINLLVLVIHIDEQKILINEYDVDAWRCEPELRVHIIGYFEILVYVLDSNNFVIVLVKHMDFEVSCVKVGETVLFTLLALSEFVGKEIVSIYLNLLLGLFGFFRVVSHDDEVLLLLLFVAEQAYDSLVVV